MTYTHRAEITEYVVDVNKGAGWETFTVGTASYDVAGLTVSETPDDVRIRVTSHTVIGLLIDSVVRFGP